MLHSVSALKKGILFAFIFSFIYVGVLYFYTKHDIAEQTNKIKEVLSTNYDWKTINNDKCSEIFINYDLNSLVVNEGDIPFYDGSNPISIISLKTLPITGSFEADGKTVSFTISPGNTIINLIIKSVLAIVFIFMTTILTASQGLKNAVKSISAMKEAIINKRYEDLPFTDLTKELTNNEKQMKDKLEEAVKKIEHLESAVAIDDMTKLYNRTVFRQNFENSLTSGFNNTNTVHLLGIIRASEIQQINTERGYQMGDKYIHDLASMIKSAISRFPTANAYRISGSDIAILMSNASVENIEAINNELKIQIADFQKSFDLTSVCYCGYTLYKAKETTENVICRADLALAKAQTGPINGYVVQLENTEGYLQGEIHWRQTVLDIINRRAIKLYFQPIKSMNISIRSYVEIFARFATKEGEILSTETVLAAAQRHDLLVKLEEMIIDTIISKYYAINNRNVRVGINLSANALISTSFLLWLERTLVRNSDIASNLVFEINEEILESNFVGAERLFSIITRSGANTSISHFGKGIESFRLYRELKPNYIKLDPNLCQSFDKDLTSQQFIRMIIEVSHRLGCVVVAEGVENTLQRQQLETLYVDAIQGYLIAKPEELTDTIDIAPKTTAPSGGGYFG